tara:strand:- start:5413 stop:6336 length:924 start_codon:yes stop_codon:yes gene_type:complete
MVLLKKKAQIVAKVEAVSGTAETSFTSADVIQNAFDATLQPSFEQIERPQQGGFGQFADVVGFRSGTATFRVELNGDGAGTAPSWAETLLPACGMKQTGEAFATTAEPVGSNLKTLTICHYQDGRRMILCGASGTFNLVAESGKIIGLEFTFTGKYKDTDDAGLITVAYSDANKPLRFANVTMTIGSWSPCVQSLSIDQGNSVILRECQTSTDASGYVASLITDRKTMLTVNPEAVLVASNDTYGQALSGAETAFSLVIDDGVDEVNIAAGAVSKVNPQQGDRNGVVTDDLQLKVLNDSWSITWSAA